MRIEAIQVVTTTAEEKHAEMLAQAVLDKRLGGCVHAMNAVLSGCMGRRQRANRFGTTASTRRASASHAQPMLQHHAPGKR